MTTFKDLTIGAKFRVPKDSRQTEWTKIEPILFEAGHVQYNATSVRGGRKFGHATKVIVPPYDVQSNAEKQQHRYQRLKVIVQAAGWKSLAELETAYLNGSATVPTKPQ